MKKYFLPVSFLFISFMSFAQDRNSRAYNTGYSIGRVLAYVLIAALVIWGISKLVKKK